MFRTARPVIRARGLPPAPRHQMSFDGEEFQPKRSSPEVLLSVPIIVDLSSISIKMMHSLLAGKNFLPGKIRIAILVVDMAVTAGMHLWMARRKSETDYTSLPLGSRIRKLKGRNVLRWAEISGRQPPE